MEFPQVKNRNKQLSITMTNGTAVSISNVEEIISSEGQQQVRIGADGRETTNDHLMETFEKVKKELNFMKDNNNPLGDGTEIVNPLGGCAEIVNPISGGAEARYKNKILRP